MARAKESLGAFVSSAGNSVKICEVCGHPVHVDSRPIGLKLHGTGMYKNGTLPLKHDESHVFLAQAPFNSSVFFRPAALSAACTDGGAKTASWPCTTWSTHADSPASCHKDLPSGDQPWQGKPRSRWRFWQGKSSNEMGEFSSAA